MTEQKPPEGFFSSFSSKLAAGWQEATTATHKLALEASQSLTTWSSEHVQENKNHETPEPWRLPDFVADQEPIIRKQILHLSNEKWSFLEPPPSELLDDFSFDMSPITIKQAQACLAADEKLAQMRFRLVPSQIKEQDFWRNYFARIHIIKRAILDATDDPSDSMLDSSTDKIGDDQIGSTAGVSDGLTIDEFEEELRKELSSFDESLNLDFGFEEETTCKD